MLLRLSIIFMDLLLFCRSRSSGVRVTGAEVAEMRGTGLRVTEEAEVEAVEDTDADGLMT